MKTENVVTPVQVLPYPSGFRRSVPVPPHPPDPPDFQTLQKGQKEVFVDGSTRSGLTTLTTDAKRRRLELRVTSLYGSQFVQLFELSIGF